MTYDEKKHARGGNPANTGEFSTKSHAMPEGALPSPAREHVPGSIAGWEVKNYKTANIGPEGGAFSASIYKDGKRVLTVSNDGWGGSDRFANPDNGVNAVGSESVRDFENDAARVLDEDPASPINREFAASRFVDLIAEAGNIQKYAKKNGFTYDEVATASLPEMAGLSDREKAVLTNPADFA